MRELLNISILLFFVTYSKAQLLVNNGSQIYFGDSALVYVNQNSAINTAQGYWLNKGFFRVDENFTNNTGKTENAGIMDINQSIINNDTLTGFYTNTGEFYVFKDWENNHVFLTNQASTFLDGNIQTIKGSEVSNFYNLTCLGMLVDIKQLFGVNAVVLNNLNLGDVEFATDIHKLTITNPNPSAITRVNGFVSSLDTGRLERATNTQLVYLFPTGSTQGIQRYRPIEISPSSNTNTIFGIRLANTNGTNESFNTDLMEDSLCAVNPNFYHRIYGNSPADITMFYDPSIDGDWTEMAHWQNVPEWQDMGSEISGTSGGFVSKTINNWSNYIEPAFALAIFKPTLDLGNDTTIIEGDIVNVFPNYTGSSNSVFSWTPSTNIDCEDCLYNELYPTETTAYILTASANNTCTVSDTMLIRVNQNQLFLPTGFSPNNDGVNDFFKPLNKNLDEYSLSVYNRWGEMIFQTDDFLNGWDGTYKGVPQEIGAYSYKATYKFKNKNNTEETSGNITLIR